MRANALSTICSASIGNRPSADFFNTIGQNRPPGLAARLRQQPTLEEALSHVFGYGICLDMTRRRLLDTSDGPRIPWELKKSFDHSAPCGPVYPVEQVGQSHLRWQLALGRRRRPPGFRPVSDDLAHAGEYRDALKILFTRPRDVIMTATPHDVGAVHPGNFLVGTIERLRQLTVTIGDRPLPAANAYPEYP
jgi:fumarylpyruvate hydrolase